MNRHTDAQRRFNCPREGCGPFVGDDLTSEDLDSLWDLLTGRSRIDSMVADWWADKPHQIAYRLLLRLTRAEDKGV